MSNISIPDLVKKQRDFFKTGASLGYEFRLASLYALHHTIKSMEGDIFKALREDLGKSPAEAYMSEIGLVLEEISFARKNLRAWMKPRPLPSPLHTFPAKSFVYPEPFGLVLNISPWNYPFQLALIPLINAVSAGNCVILKPSSRTPQTAMVLNAIVSQAFAPQHVSLVQGEGAVSGDALLKERFDFIVYTGSANVGKKVMQAASANLTPLCLELGGKSPAIVWADADLKHAARSIAWGKMLNAGQTCIAPDYLLVEKSVKPQLESLLQAEFERFPGLAEAGLQNENYAKIINAAALQRLEGLSKGKAKIDYQSRRMLPLLLPDVQASDAVMQEEIFGPILPVLGFEHTDEVLEFVRAGEKPLACYLFTNNKAELDFILKRMSFGGGCINDTMLHTSSSYLPFGGVGHSGMGRYHGKHGFDLFSNMKGILHKKTWLDIPLRYLPIKEQAFSWLRRFLS